MGRTTGAAVKIYQITYIFGFFFGGLLHLIVNYFFPAPGLGISEGFDEGIVEGVIPSSASEGEEGVMVEKGPVVGESKL